MDRKEIQNILTLHGKWLENEPDGIRADMQGADLRGANLHGADLHGANLHGADLHGANLRWANLQYANLQGANLHGANLRWANLQYANLQGAILRGTDLKNANLYDAYLQGADLRNAQLQGANLLGADLRNAQLQGANLQDATLDFVGFRLCQELDEFRKAVIPMNRRIRREVTQPAPKAELRERIRKIVSEEVIKDGGLRMSPTQVDDTLNLIADRIMAAIEGGDGDE